MPGESNHPEDSEPHEHVMIPALNYRRPDELSDFHLMYVLDLVAEQMQERGIRIIGRGLCYISAAHTEADLDETLATCRGAMAAAART